MRRNSSGKLARVLSVLLTFCMVVGMLPAIANTTAEAAGAPAPSGAIYEYDFYKLMYSSKTFFPFTDLTDFGQTTIGDAKEIYKDTNYCDGTSPFIFVEQGGTDANLRVTDTAYCAMFDGDANAYFTMKLRIGAAGTYLLQNRAGCYSGGGEVKFYFAPDGTANPISDTYYVGSINTNSSTVNWQNIMDIGNVTASAAGDYIVVAQKTAAASRFATSGYILTTAKTTPTPNPGTGTGGGTTTPETPADPVITVSIGALGNIVVGDTATAPLSITVDGAASNFANATLSVKASDSSVLTPSVSKSGNNATLSVKALKKGNSVVTVTATIGGKDYTASKTVKVTETAAAGTSSDLFFYADQTALAPSQTDGTYVHVTDRKMQPVTTNIKYESTNEDVIKVDASGKVVPVKVGKAEIIASLSYKGTEYALTLPFSVTEGKSAASYYTGTRVEALRENRQKYQWAVEESVTNIKKADWYLEHVDDIYGMMTTQELPRSATVGYRYDPDNYKCRYCGIDFATSSYGSYAWMLDPINKPWQVICPDCRHVFPSNDFEKFYALGIKDDGNWSYELAKSENAKLVAAGQAGYLVNERNPEKGTGWGVDDGYGYHTGITITNSKGKQAEQVHTYISYYNHWGVWYGTYGGDNAGLMVKLMNTFTEAYINTGDVKYGKVGAMMVDRMADLNPDFSIAPYYPNFFNSDSTTPKGKVVGCIWQHGLTRAFVLGYDAFYDAYDDPRVLEYIQQQSGRHTALPFDKSNAVAIRENIEERLILQTYKDIRSTNIYGNFGMHQSLAAFTAVVYDSLPKTKEILDWTYANHTSGSFGSSDVNGGNVNAQLINLVDRDGLGAESGANYNVLWINSLLNIFGATEGYTKYTGADSFQNPRVQKMFKAYLPLTIARKATVQIGDSGATALSGYQMSNILILKGFMNTGDVEMAQFLYHINKGNMLDVHADKWTKNPEAVQQQVLDVIKEHGEYDFDQSQILPAYGFSILRDGTYKKGATAAASIDTQRDMWMYYGAANSHKHADVLNLGIEAFGVSVLPDLGYPTTADGSDRTTYWEMGTASHATVMVNNVSHNRIRSYSSGTRRNNGRPLHFDDSGRVKVMDSIAPTNATSAGGTFRRSVVMIKVDDENSYGVDFFRVQGGSTHHYNFHALSNKVHATEGLTLTAQSGGTYAGTNVAFGKTGVSSGFSYLYNVRTSPCSSGNFAVDFSIQDFRDEGWGSKDIHLRVTMLNDFALEHVAIAKGKPPIKDDNPEELEFVLAKRSGTSLDSLFTAVYEPYKVNRFITKIESVPVSTTARVAKAVKVTRADGIIDYIVYCNDETKTVRVDNKFDFVGFIGVYSEKDGKVAYTYGQEASQVGPTTGTKNYTGTITDFTKTMAKQNYITVQFNSAIDVSKIIGKLLVDTSVTTDNANVMILGAESLGSNKYKLDIGDASMITAVDSSGNYIYNCAVGNNISIPLALIGNEPPKFNKIDDISTEVGAEVKFTVSAKGAEGKTLTYKMTSAPSNATFDATTGQFSWVPASSHRGDNIIAFEVSDGVLTDTMYVTATVFGGSGGGGGGGGGAGGGGGGG
ncbi:MAG: heparinase II/III family protein, partial [Clostridia bacterium]|nr:heparinase II/III family protein [Clostridia bacterium]